MASDTQPAAAADAYFAANALEIEDAIEAAVDEAVACQASDPLLHIANALLRRPAKKNFEWAVHMARAHARQQQQSEEEHSPAAAALTRAAESSDDSLRRWRAKKWLESLDLIEILTDALLKPLKAEDPDVSLERGYVEALGQHSTAHPIIQSIERSLQDIGEKIFKAAKRLSSSRHGAEDVAGSNQETSTSKFFEDADGAVNGTLRLGELSQFFMGLVGFVGPPNPNLRDSMIGEHCESKDSQRPFRVRNYQTVTTPQIEWFFVVEPTEENLATLGLKSWPSEPRLGAKEDAIPAGDSGERGRVRRRRRVAFDIKNFEDELGKHNGLLRDMGHTPLLDDEFFAARLYTGPMFQKYNTVLREVGRARAAEKDHYLSATQIEDEVSRCDTLGNMYTTTLHVINSATIKLSKLTAAATVYRGISIDSLPIELEVKNASNVRGGVEFAFLSCSKDREEALIYAKNKTYDKSVLMELQMGMIDRGADFAWLSQYPHEQEVLFAPLSGLEVLSHRLEDDVLVVEVRPSVNLSALTIEDVVAKMRSSHVQLLDMLAGDLKFAGVPKGALTPLTQYKTEVQARPPEWFNTMSNYSRATEKARACQSEVFKLLADPKEAELILRMESRKIRKTALICARAGQHDLAVELLLLASQREDTEHRHNEIKAAAPRLQAANAPTSAVPLDITAEKLDPVASQLSKMRRVSSNDDSSTAPPTVSSHHTLSGSRLLTPPKLSRDEMGQYSDAEQRLYKIAAVMVEGGLQQPWAETFASLSPMEAVLPSGNGADADGTTSSTKSGPTLPMALFEKLTVHLVKHQAPFRVGARVLCQDGNQRWEPATVVSVHGPTTRAPMLGTVERSPSAGAAKPTDGVEEPTFELKSWRTLTGIPQSRVLATDADTGVGAMLRHASRSGKPGLVGLLLQSNINLYQSDVRGNTCLILAARNGHDHVCKQLLESVGDDLNSSKGLHALRNTSRQNAYDLAVSAKYAKVTRLLTPSPSDKDATERDLAEFHRIVSSSSGEEQLKRALSSWSGTNGITALMLACRSNNGRLAEALLGDGGRAKDELRRMSKGGCTALTMAAEEGHVEMIRMLLNRGAEPDLCKDGRSALMLACQAGHLDVVRKLVECDADVNIQRVRSNEEGANTDKRTALMIACQFGHSECAQELLGPEGSQQQQQQRQQQQLGGGRRSVANIDALNANGESALMFASRYGHEETVQLLLDRGINLAMEARKRWWTSLHRAAANGHSGTARRLLRHAESKGIALLNHVDEEGVTALKAAAGSNHGEMVAWLLDANGIDFAVADAKGRTALFEAAINGQLDATTQLLNFGDGLKDEKEKRVWSEDVLNRPDHEGLTPLMAACEMGYADVVRALLNAHAEVSSPRSKQDALSVAARVVGNKQVVHLLLSISKDVSMEHVNRATKLASEQGDEDICGLLRNRQITRSPTNRAFSALVTRESIVKAQEEERLESSQIQDDFAKLTFAKLFNGMLVPPRPSERQIYQLETPTGPLAETGGVVSQRGPFDSIWLRAGCKPNVPWYKLWQTLQKHVECHLETQRAIAARRDNDQQPKPIYVAVSQRCMQAIDFMWLADRGFVFHHYRKPGHGEAEEAAVSPPRARRDTLFEVNAEFVYYCFPGQHDPVPVYATSIEGATGVVLSTDEARVLLVWERGAWSTPGGAVDAGECKFEALVREVREEVAAQIDESWGAYYLGGWQSARARDHLVNDNFSGFVVKLKSDYFAVDGREIKQARFFAWRPLLDGWRKAKKPKDFELQFAPGSGEALPENRRKFNKILMKWLDTYETGRALACKLEKTEQGPPHAKVDVMKMHIGA